MSVKIVFQITDQALLPHECLCMLWSSAKFGRYFCSITYTTEDKKGIRRKKESAGTMSWETMGANMHVSECKRGRLLRIWQQPHSGDVCSWYDIWCDLNLDTNTQTCKHALRHRCAHSQQQQLYQQGGTDRRLELELELTLCTWHRGQAACCCKKVGSLTVSALLHTKCVFFTLNLSLWVFSSFILLICANQSEELQLLLCSKAAQQ